MKLAISETDIKEITTLKGYSFLFHQQRKKKIIELATKNCKKGSRILDVGCANGDIAVEFALLGYTVHGIDQEPMRLNKAKNLAEKYNAKIVFENKTLEDLEKNDKYDLVLLGEVLEHFTDPKETLITIKKLLKPESIVLITTPNMPSLRNRLQFGILGVFPDNNPEHKFYFDSRRFSEVASAANYKILHFSTHFANLIKKSLLISYIENIFLFWFTALFSKSGDTIFAVIKKNTIPENN